MKKTISGIRGIVGDDLSVADVMEFCSNFCMPPQDVHFSTIKLSFDLIYKNDQGT